MKKNFDVSKLSQSKRCYIARKTSDVKRLEKLAEDQSFWVKTNVLLNQHLTPKILEKLSKDSNSIVRHMAKTFKK